MKADEFSPEAPGRLVQTTRGQVAFVPKELPPGFTWLPQTVRLLAEAERALGRLAGLGLSQSSGFQPNVFLRPFARREAVLSSRIEGTTAGLSDLLRFEDAPESVERTVPDVREVANYVDALDFGRQAIEHRSLTVSLIKELHQNLMRGVRGGEALPGAFRREQVFIGSSHRIEEARYVPPPPTEVDRLMSGLENYLSRRSELPPLVRMAMVHYHFEAIHPFRDGNGRVGRLLMTLMLLSDDLLPAPMLYLSAFFERNRAEYYTLLLEVSTKGAWHSWVGFVLRAVIEEAADAIARIGRLLQLRAEYHEMIQRTRVQAASIKLIDALFADPLVTARRAALALGLTVAATQAQIDRLVAAGILREITGGKRYRVYMADGIMRLLVDEKP
jgi:Fic family protein